MRHAVPILINQHALSMQNVVGIQQGISAIGQEVVPVITIKTDLHVLVLQIVYGISTVIMRVVVIAVLQLAEIIFVIPGRPRHLVQATAQERQVRVMRMNILTLLSTHALKDVPILRQNLNVQPILLNVYGHLPQVLVIM